MIGAVRELRASAVILALTSAIGCIGRPVVGGEPPDAAKAYPARWPCPSGWVHERFGACGPAALLCVPDGGAAPGACARVDLTRPPRSSSRRVARSEAFVACQTGASEVRGQSRIASR